ncbi:MAG: cellulase family glycosylhydrolase [Proteobacteria bacterium]|nr:cellulase family glycosylhydrolase [Pseudomonadota bacterium]
MKRFIGTNCYFLQEEGARECLGWTGYDGRVDEALRKCAGLGLTVVRAWAFNDDPDNPVAIQPAPGQLSEAGLAGIDLALERAAAHGVQLILSLGNFWEDYGGVPQYLRWHNARGGFFGNSKIIEHYGDHIEALLSRVNPRTGIAWGHDPAVLGWELMNEPRGRIAGWVEQLVPRVRAAAPDHLVLTGGEGQEDDWDESSALVDVASIHLYPEEWGWPDAADAGVRWIRSHADRAAALNKPLLLGEFGLSNRRGLKLPERRRIYRRWLAAARAHPAVLGACSWSFSTDDRPDAWDEFTWTWRDGTDPSAASNRYADLHRDEAARWA